MRHTNSKGVLFKTLHTAAEISLDGEGKTLWTCIRESGSDGQTLPLCDLCSIMFGSEGDLEWSADSRSLAFLLAAEYVKTDSLEGYRAAQAKKYARSQILKR